MSSKGKKDSSDEDAEDDETLNLMSPLFDPLKALYARETKVKVPCLKAPIYDNTTRFELGPSGLTIKGPTLKKIKDVPPEQPSTSRSIPEPLSDSKQNTRGFKRHNVLTRMEGMTGPLALLRDCMERRVRIKVFTRSVNGIRGYCIGFVAAFDKMWNLALEDVKEVWTRKIKRKCIPVGPGVDTTTQQQRRIRPPRILVTKLDRKTERCERHISQLLMRGEHVALISVID